MTRSLPSRRHRFDCDLRAVHPRVASRHARHGTVAEHGSGICQAAWAARRPRANRRCRARSMSAQSCWDHLNHPFYDKGPNDKGVGIQLAYSLGACADRLSASR